MEHAYILVISLQFCQQSSVPTVLNAFSNLIQSQLSVCQVEGSLDCFESISATTRAKTLNCGPRCERRREEAMDSKSHVVGNAEAKPVLERRKRERDQLQAQIQQLKPLAEMTPLATEFWDRALKETSDVRGGDRRPRADCR